MRLQSLPLLGARHLSVPRPCSTSRTAKRPPGRPSALGSIEKKAGQREGADLGDPDGQSKVLGGICLQLELPQVVRERPVECLLSRREEHWEVGEPGARIRLVHDLSHYGETVRIDGALDLQPDREPSGPVEELTRRGAG